MVVSVSRLRSWFAMAAVTAVLMVGGFYWYARTHLHFAVSELPQKLGIEIQQSTQGFSLSKSESGHTLYTVHASKAVQYKEGGRADLKDVKIVIYGRESDRYDQISGSDFEYEPESGNVIAHGQVHIDLQAATAGPSHPDQAEEPAASNPLHVVTTGLVFNQKTGNARSDGRVDFRTTQASGWAVGLNYDSKLDQLVLWSQVHISTLDAIPTNVVAQRAVLTKKPRQAVLYGAHLERQSQSVDAPQATIFLNDDNSVDHIHATGGVNSTTQGPTLIQTHAPEALLYVDEHSNQLRTGKMLGGTTFETSGDSTMRGAADLVTVDFTADNHPGMLHALGHVTLVQFPKPGDGKPKPAGGDSTITSSQTVELHSDIVDFWLDDGPRLRRAETSERAEILIYPPPSATPPPVPGPEPRTWTSLGQPVFRSSNSEPVLPRTSEEGQAPRSDSCAGGAGEQRAANGTDLTVVTADKFYAAFNAEGRLDTLTGYPHAHVVSHAPGEADRVSSSRLIDVRFAPVAGIESLIQQDNFEYHEKLPNGTERAAWSERATYLPATQVLTLHGAPRIVEGGMTTTARVLHLNRQTGDAFAEGDVKSTYSDLQAQPGGSFVASGDPVHVTARTMTAQRSTGMAHYAGEARLWQNTNVVQGSVIDFDRDRRTVLATASAPVKPVNTLLVQRDQKTGKETPVRVMSSSALYEDLARVVHFKGRVTAHSSTEGTLTANEADVFLTPAASPGPGVKRTAGAGPSAAPSPGADGIKSNFGSTQIDHMVARGDVHLQQPTRLATGEHLVYTAADDKYVLTGGSPTVTDSEHGVIQGATLTFFRDDDRVLVESGKSGRSVTNTRVSK